MTAEPHQPAWRAAAFGGNREASSRSEVERFRIAPKFADHGRETGASYPLLHCPQRIASIARFDMDKILHWEAWRIDPPALEDRHAVLDPQQRFIVRNLREEEADPAAIAGMRGEQL